MGEHIHRCYYILLADPKRDPEYAEGSKVGGYPVFGTANEMRDRFSAALGRRMLPSMARPLQLIPAWHVDDCALLFETKPDSDAPGSPWCFGYLSVVGLMQNVEVVHRRLTRAFPGIEALVRDHEYRTSAPDEL